MKDAHMQETSTNKTLLVAGARYIRKKHPIFKDFVFSSLGQHALLRKTTIQREGRGPNTEMRKETVNWTQFDAIYVC